MSVLEIYTPKLVKVLYCRKKFNILMLTDQLRNDQWDSRFIDICSILSNEGHNITILATNIRYDKCLDLTFRCQMIRQIGTWLPKHICGIFRRIFHAIRSLYMVFWASYYLRPKPELLFTNSIHLSAIQLYRFLNKQCRIIMLFQAYHADQIPKTQREYRINSRRRISCSYEAIDEVICPSLLTTYVFTYTQRPMNGPKYLQVLYSTKRYIEQSPPPILPLPGGSYSFVAINNLTINSNFTVAVEAFSILYGLLEDKFRKRIYLILITHFPKTRRGRKYAIKLKTIIDSYGMNDKIFILFDIPISIQNALIAASFAYLHLQPHVVSEDNLIQAMAVGKPIIATNSGFPCEIIKDRKTGFLLPLCAESFADAMEELILHPDRYEIISENINATYEENFSYTEFKKHVIGIVTKYDDHLLIEDNVHVKNQNVVDLNNALEVIHRNNTNLPLINALVTHQELISDRYYRENKLYGDVPDCSFKK